jgi:hypothetical protein
MASLLKQANQFLNLIAQREPGLLEWDLQALNESGFISDLLLLNKEEIARIDRQAFRKFIGLQPMYQVLIQGGSSINNLIIRCQLEHYQIADEIKDALFGIPIGFQGSFDAHLVLVSKRASTEVVVRDMKAQGLRPAIAAELLCFVAQHLAVEVKGYKLVALGNPSKIFPRGYLAFNFGPEPYLHLAAPRLTVTKKAGANANLYWPAGLTFLAVPTPERGGPRYFTGS